jgi:hypothetical protein
MIRRHLKTTKHNSCNAHTFSVYISQWFSTSRAAARRYKQHKQGATKGPYLALWPALQICNILILCSYTKMGVTEIRYGDVDWDQLAQDRYRWRAMGNIATNSRFLKSRPTLQPCSMGSVGRPIRVASRAFWIYIYIWIIWFRDEST